MVTTKPLEVEAKPYSEVQLSSQVVVRTFSASVPTEELQWHWDPEDRLVEPLGENDWQFQFDNCLPERIYRPIHIPAGQIHRVIAGSGDLVIKITKS